MCLGEWSLKGYVENRDIIPAEYLPDLLGDEGELLDDWDAI
jgi:hypothetical protein